MDPGHYYITRRNELQEQLSKLKQKKSVLGWLRFGTIAGIIAGIYILWSLGWPYIITVAVILAMIFARLVLNDIRNSAAIGHTFHLININIDELKALDNNYFHFEPGNAFIPREHLYANDLDLFGRASVYQYINRTTSEPGSTTLSNWLLQPAAVESLLKRQEAVKELSKIHEWKQELQAIGKEKKIQWLTLERINAWLQERDIFSPFKAWAWLKYILPVIILTVTVLTIFDYVTLNTFYVFLFVFAVIAFKIDRKVVPIHTKLSKIVEEVEVLSDSIALIENATFQAPLLIQLKEQFSHTNGKASAALSQLKKILDRLDIRYNIVLSAPLNLFLQWNLHQVTALEKWKKQNGNQIGQWFTALGELEALSSLSTIAFNNPGWCFPLFRDEHFFIEGTDIGHPLISAAKRVNNPLRIDSAGELMLVTGSNMAGKSTYLRSIGVNVVLAMAGGPVCARSFHLSPVQIVSSMRIADNLEESTSTFYAELKKLKTIIEKVNKGEKVLILLDEILRGTNSLDRHTGSVALIRQLIKYHAAGIIATHDVELAELKKEFPLNILNYHFDVQVNNDELFFDYELKEGVCTSLNASILMKKIGIEL